MWRQKCLFVFCGFMCLLLVACGITAPDTPTSGNSETPLPTPPITNYNMTLFAGSESLELGGTELEESADLAGLSIDFSRASLPAINWTAPSEVNMTFSNAPISLHIWAFAYGNYFEDAYIVADGEFVIPGESTYTYLADTHYESYVFSIVAQFNDGKSFIYYFLLQGAPALSYQLPDDIDCATIRKLDFEVWPSGLIQDEGVIEFGRILQHSERVQSIPDGIVQSPTPATFQIELSSGEILYFGCTEGKIYFSDALPLTRLPDRCFKLAYKYEDAFWELLKVSGADTELLCSANKSVGYSMETINSSTSIQDKGQTPLEAAEVLVSEVLEQLAEKATTRTFTIDQYRNLQVTECTAQETDLWSVGFTVEVQCSGAYMVENLNRAKEDFFPIVTSGAILRQENGEYILTVGSK